MGEPGSTAASRNRLPADVRDDARLWAALAHLGGVVSVLPSLLIYLAFRDRERFTADQAKEALNFQITLVGTYLATVLGELIVGAVVLEPVDWVHLGFAIALAAASIVFSILGFLSARTGAAYRYPFCVRLIN
jgi:uncharacterized protein